MGNEPIPVSATRELIDGSAAVVRGALDAGCDFFAGYPITPASLILAGMLRELPARGGVGIQGEDEIASISMCIGAAMTGARTLTATSGPGISLYSENIGLAIMGEVPLVIVDVQRLGPATGGATTVGQGDVQFVRWGTSGGYPIIALAPSTVRECRSLTIEAFRLAERFRCPVFLLLDKELALTLDTVQWDDDEAQTRPRERGPSASHEPERQGPFKPYRYDPPGQTPRLVPFGGPELVRFTGSSHDERGLLTKDTRAVGALNRHLARKIEEHRDDLERVLLDVQPGAQTLLVSYGVTAGAMRAAVRQVRAVGRSVSAVTLHGLWPVPEKSLRRLLDGIRRVVVAELNLGDYRREIERVAPRALEIVGVNRVDGELVSPRQILEAVV